MGFIFGGMKDIEDYYKSYCESSTNAVKYALEESKVRRELQRYEKEIEYYKGYNKGYEEGLKSMNVNTDSFYRFPDMSAGKDLDLSDQFEKIEEELEEAKHAYYNNAGNEHAILEVMDVLHAVETWFRIEGLSYRELKAYSTLIQRKNSKRGYYDIPASDKDGDD